MGANPARPTWDAVAALLERALGEPVDCEEPLGRPRSDRVMWAARADGVGGLVVKARYGDFGEEKTRWSAAHLPLLAQRGYPVPEIVWHGRAGGPWYVVVQRRLPGAPIGSLDARLLDALLALVELQAEAGFEAGERDFATYQAYVLFEGWDHVWRDAEAASPEARLVCARVRRWLEPVWGHRLPARDFAHNDLNLTNILTDGETITGVVDWDEAALNSRAVDLTALAFDCTRRESIEAERSALPALFDRVNAIAGEAGLRCVVSYRVLTHLAALVRRAHRDAVGDSVARAHRVLDFLGAP